jgi:AcrR family transcriptional regulator
MILTGNSHVNYGVKSMSAKAKALEAPGDLPGNPAAAGKEKACERIFKAACELFYRQGIRAVGVETIAEEANATKMSLYRTYPSKDNLVAEYLRSMSALYWQKWDELAAQHAGDPRKQLRVLFAEIARHIGDPGARGCAIANASVELTEPDHPGRKIIAEHKAQVRARLFRLCSELRARDPAALADGLFLLMEGAQASTQCMGCEGPGNAVARTADALIEAHLPR